MAFLWFTYCLLLWTITGVVGRDVFLERPQGQTVDLKSPVRLNCTANDTTASSSVQWRRGDSVVTEASGVLVQQGSLQLAAIDWSDIGVYTCIITFGGNTSYAAATLNITGYVKPYVNAEKGVSTFTHVVGEEQMVECPIAGHPGPESFYWQNTSSGVNVSSDVSMESGVFIDDLGRLDVSRVEAANSELFLCVGVDAVGNTASTRIRVSSVDAEEEEADEKLDPLEWYFILAYSVGGALVFCGLVVVAFVCWLNCDQCCERIAQRKATRVRVRRSQVTLDDTEEVNS